jgi:hypothetical protein
MFYIERHPRRFKAVQWTGKNLDEVLQLDPWQIHWDDRTHMLCVDTVPVAPSEYVVDGPGGISVISPELFAMQYAPALEAA